MDVSEISGQIIDAGLRVHRNLGPGLLESAYEECLCYELKSRGIGLQRQVKLPVDYEDIRLDAGYRIDLLVEDAVVVELKAVEELLPIHEAQLLTYLRLSDKQVGLLLNFNVQLFKNGIVRMVNNFRG